VSSFFGVKTNNAGAAVPVWSRQNFTMIARRDMKAVSGSEFTTKLVSKLAGISKSVVQAVKYTSLKQFNETDGVFTEILVSFASTDISSNVFRDALLKALPTGYLATYSIIAFGENKQVPRNFCPDGTYGPSCLACGACAGVLTCDDGTMGTGKCTCPSVFVSDRQVFDTYSGIPGRCLAVSDAALDAGTVPVEVSGGISHRSVVVKNVGSTPESISGTQLTLAEDMPSDAAAFFRMTSTYNYPYLVRPGESITFTISFQPDYPATYLSNLLVFVDNDESKLEDDATTSVALSVTGSIADLVPQNGRIVGVAPIYRIDVGSNQDTHVDGKKYGADLWTLIANVPRFESRSDFINLNPLYRSYVEFNPVSPSYHFRLPVKFPGNLALSFLTVDFTSSDVNQRLFNINANGKVINPSAIDVFAQAGGVGKLVNLTYVVTGDFSKTDLLIRLESLTNAPIVSALEVYQFFDLSTAIPPVVIPDINYADALHKTFLFFNSMESGKINRRLAWRKDSCKKCFGPEGQDLTGGFHEAGGNYLKINFPLAATLSNVGMGMLEHKNGYRLSNETEYALAELKHGLDYFINSRLDSERIVLMIGKRDVDFNYNGPPERYEENVRVRPIYLITKEHRSSETCGEVAATLAIGSMVFKTVDPAYSAKLLSEAVEYYMFGKTYQGSYSENPGANEGFQMMARLYPSKSYFDELAWAAAWIYRASSIPSYFSEAKNFYMEYQSRNGHGCGWGYSWDEKGPMLHILLGMIDTDASNRNYYDSRTTEYLNAWLPGKYRTVPHTPKGMAYLVPWGSVRYAANTAYLALLYSRVLKSRNQGTAEYRTSLYNYGKSQIDYILGAKGTSMMVGVGLNQPTVIFHKPAASSHLCYPSRTYHIAYGSVTGGPILVNNQPTDLHWNNGRIGSFWQYTEPGMDYSGALSAALALLNEDYPGRVTSDSELDLGWSYSCSTNSVPPGISIPIR
jgi:hypothetical protein